MAELEEFANRVPPKDRVKNEQGPQTTKSGKHCCLSGIFSIARSVTDSNIIGQRA